MGLNSPLQHTNPTTDKHCLECKHSAVQRSVQGCTSESSHSPKMCLFISKSTLLAGVNVSVNSRFPHLPLSVSWYQLQPPHSPPTDGPVANARMEYGLEKNTSLTLNVKKWQSAFIPNIIICPNTFQGRELLVARSK